MTSLEKARALAIAVPAALLAGAYGSEIFGGLHPCEMCWWQRYAHFAGLGLAMISFSMSSLLRPAVPDEAHVVKPLNTSASTPA